MTRQLAALRWEPKKNSTARAAMHAGFAVVFGLWVTWGYQLFRGLQQIQGSVMSAHESYLRGDQTLSSVRTNVLLGSIYLRDALIETSSERRLTYGNELRRSRLEGEQLLSRYVPQVESPDERNHWSRLQSELNDYWASLDIAFADQPKTPEEAAALLRGSVVPRRDAALEILDQLAVLQREANARHQQDTDLLYRTVSARLFTMGFGTLVGALAVAGLASHHANLLQREIDRQRRIERRTSQDLERLSARLVDAQDEERRTLARELHDEVGQALTAVKMDIGIALRGDVDPRIRKALEEARDLSETTLQSVRDMSQLLHPSVLDDFGLPATVTTYLRNFSERTGIRAQLAETTDARMAPEVELCVYRIVQEALSNVARHSGATVCTVFLNSDVGQLRLRVEDNGRGIGAVAGEVAARGLGLIGMRERAQALGGNFTIGDRADGGTALAVVLPLPLGETPPAGDLAVNVGRRAG